MRLRYAAVLLVLLAAPIFCQTVTTLNLSTQGHNPDFSTFPFTRPISTGSAVPSTCQMGQMFFNTAAAAGQNIYACTQTNVWTILGAYSLLPAGPTTLGGVIVSGNSVLSVDSNGVLSANVGTGPGTLAAGDDTRIANALQPTSQISATHVVGLASSATTDTTNASNIASGTLKISLLPSTISSNTTGNAATATAFSLTPKACSAGQFSQGVTAAGNATCTQVAYGQVSGTPSLYNQTLQVGAKTQTQRANVNFAAGSNVTITPTDNGLNTTTVTISDTGLQPPSSLNSIVKYSTGTSTTAAQPSDIISALGFTPQNANGLNAPAGYAGLDANGLLLVNEMPPTIRSGTTGNAATATALAVGPAACVGNQFAQGILANGAAICGTPVGTGGGLPDPGSNGLVKRTAANADSVASAGVDYYAPGTLISDADLPNTITSSITGNAATASALALAPTGCPGGQFVTQIAANGNPVSCGSAGSGGPTVSTGTADPLGSKCTSASVGAMYIQTSLSTSTTGAAQGLYGCSAFGGTYRWQAYHNGVVNALSFGARADGSTDDSGAIQNAINFAKTAQLYGGNYWGGTVYFPAGKYRLNSHIVLPRDTLGNGGLNYGSNNGVVSLIGESQNATILDFSGDATDAEGIAWDQTVAERTTAQVIKNFTIEMPAKAGAYGIHYQYTSVNQSKCHNPGSISDGGVGCYNERQEDAIFENLNFEGSSATAKASLYLEGDCIQCTFKDFNQRSTGAGSTYNTVLILADQCYFSGAENTEACGLNLSVVENMSAGSTGGGGASVFIGRMGDTHFNTSFCDGSYGASANPYCYAFYNSAGNFFDGLFTEGGGGVFFYLNNCHLNNFKNWGLGSPITTWNSVVTYPQYGLLIVNSSENTFDKEAADTFISGAWQQKLGTASGTSGFVINGGSGYISAPTCTTDGSATCVATVSGGAVNYVYVNSAGTGSNITLSGGGGTGATGDMTQAFKVYVDPTSHNNQFIDLQVTGSFASEVGYTSSDGTNYFHWCDATNGTSIAKCRTGPMGKIGTSPY